MSPRTRILAKAVTWQTLGLIMMSVIGYVHTGSWISGGGIAITTTAIGAVTYALHEWLWERGAR
ncbi:MAG: DUF2061 domain-containing protein [Pseudomonadota bacterium]